MKLRITFFMCFLILCSAWSWGQTSVSSTSIHFDVSGGLQTLAISSGAKWTISSTEEWVKVNGGQEWSDDYATTIIVTADPNTSSTKRTAILNLIDENNGKSTITVTQNGTDPVLSVSPASLHFDATEGEQTFKITGNGSRWWINDRSYEGWCNVTHSESGYSGGDATVTVKVLANRFSTSSRTTNITLTDYEYDRVVAISVTQDGQEPVLSVPAALNFAGSGEQQIIPVTTNLQWRARSSASWLTLEQSTVRDDGTITVTAAANISKAPRTATITLDGDFEQPVQRTITVTQDEGFIFSVSPSSLDVDYTGGQQTFTIMSNTYWLIESDADWLSFNTWTGSNNSTITATVSENLNPIPRTATITIKTNDGVAAEHTITVTQAKKPNSDTGLKQTWNLTPTMTATLDIDYGILTVKTTKEREAMPGSNFPWETVRLAITSVIIEDGVGTVGWGAFRYMANLLSVTIPNSVTTIEGMAFEGCINLTSVTIPNSVTTIGEDAFSGCSRMASVTFGNSVTMIGDRAFEGCNTLASVTIPNSVTTIGYDAFRNCSRLTSVTLGNSVSIIENSAFLGCGLTAVDIPHSVTNIGSYAFGCRNLKDVTVHWIIPLTVEQNSPLFGEAFSQDMTLHVPDGTENLYILAPYWKGFNIVTYTVANESITSFSLKAYATDGMLHVSGLQTGMMLRIYNLAGQLIYNGITKAAEEQIPLATQGMYVVVAGEESVKVYVERGE